MKADSDSGEKSDQPLAQALLNLDVVLAVRQFDKRNLFCSEQLRDAELTVKDGREDGGPAFHSTLNRDRRAGRS